MSTYADLLRSVKSFSSDKKMRYYFELKYTAFPRKTKNFWGIKLVGVYEMFKYERIEGSIMPAFPRAFVKYKDIGSFLIHLALDGTTDDLRKAFRNTIDPVCADKYLPKVPASK